MKSTLTRLTLVFASLALTMSIPAGANAQETALIPRPASVERGSGVVTVSSAVAVVAGHHSLQSVAELAAAYLAQVAGESHRVVQGHSNASGTYGETATSAMDSRDTGRMVVHQIALALDDTLPAEGYELRIDTGGVIISGGGPAGVFYGVQTLRQLLPVEQDGLLQLPVLWIADAPRFQWRGMHVDVSRHFFSTAELRRFIDRMVLYRFNRLHLHLTDDQGWRLEIAKYPELTSEGAWRRLNSQDSTVLQLGTNNPDFQYLPPEHFRGAGDARRYGGYYTRQEMRELVQYAAERHVTIVPEIDMPGHMMAAIASYPGLSCTGAAEWGDTFSVPLCVAKEEVLEFVENVISEVVEVFPSPWIHIGGDEVEKDTWEANAEIRDLMRREGLTSLDEVQAWFIARVSEMLAARGRKMIGWDEILDGGQPEGAVIMHWRGWVPDAPVVAVRSGSDVIRSPTTCCYLDYEESDGTLAQVYSFEPVPPELNDSEAQRILGVQGNLWSEWIPSPEQQEYMAFPRMLAIAEIAWTDPDRRDWTSFSRRLFEHYPRLDAMGVHYRVPSLTTLHERTVVLRDTVIQLSPPLPGIEIRYTTDGSPPTRSSPSHLEPVSVTGAVSLRIRALYPSGRAGPVEHITIEKQQPREASEPGDVEPGLRLEYFQARVTRVDSIVGEPSRVESVPDVSVPDHLRAEAFAVVYTGYVRVPQTGVYTFTLESDDGSTLHIGDHLVVDNDEPHGPLAVSGQVALGAGVHPITLRFFESGGGYTLQLRWSGPGVVEGVVPASAFVH